MVDVAQLVEPRIVIPAVAGSNPVVHPTFFGGTRWEFLSGFYGPLAQLVEQLTLNQLVVGSIPTRPTIYPIKITICTITALSSFNSENINWSQVRFIELDSFNQGLRFCTNSIRAPGVTKE